MNKLSTMRQWSERISGVPHRPPNMPGQPPMNPLQNKMAHVPVSVPVTGMAGAGAMMNAGPVFYTFNVPFAYELAGPNTEDILHSTADAVLRWTHPEDAPDDVPVAQLPVHVQNLDNLDRLCADITGNPNDIEARTTTRIPVNGKTQVTTVCLAGNPEYVYRTREAILNETPLYLRCTTIDINGDMVADLAAGTLKPSVTAFLDHVSGFCGVDIFLLGPKLTVVTNGMNGDTELRCDQRWRVAIYGDNMSTEHAKTRVLIHIDQILNRHVDFIRVEPGFHQPLCGRNRKNIKHIESLTGTAIYMPPAFSTVFRYCPPNAHQRDPCEIYLTGDSPESIAIARGKINEVLQRTRLFPKDISIPGEKIDSILLSRMDKVRKITETNGASITFPPLGSRHKSVRVSATENLHTERTVRELMALAGQFYSGYWSIAQTDARQMPTAMEIQAILCDVCLNSDADVAFQGAVFSVTGSDDAVKKALNVLSETQLAMHLPYQIKVKIELANEHKEFVSGKKNGKINKIMGQSNVQILFESFGEYNFNIDVNAQSYESMKQGLSLVEQEMPASISFHVPDQYHKRIIGIGGQHIQRIMKKHSVFVKFSNAMDRGGMGREEDDIRVDNVICRTPARNAQNLELVKSEILEMVDRVDSEFTSQSVNVDRLYHRRLIARMTDMDMLEKKWNCKIGFPSTEQASDEVTITGPQWQVQQCVDEFLGMVPDNHEVVFVRTPELVKYLCSADFTQTMVPALKAQYEVDVSVTMGETPTLEAVPEACEEAKREAKLEAKLEEADKADKADEAHEADKAHEADEDAEASDDDGGAAVSDPDAPVSDPVGPVGPVGPVAPVAPDTPDTQNTPVTMLWTFTRNNAGGLRDAMDYLTAQLTTAGVDVTVIKGSIPRPQSDTFENALPHFNSKLLQHAPAGAAESPTQSSFGEEVARERSTIFERLRKPGSSMSISSFLDRRKNSSQNARSLFKGSANGSKSSLISIESTRSFNADRYPWNDSGVNLGDDEPWPTRPFSNSGLDHHMSLSIPVADPSSRYNPRQSGDSGRPSTSNSTNSGFPMPRYA